ncbi:MAG TPA: hypothetical protein VIR38_06975, partial [Thalassobaculum sp.]
AAAYLERSAADAGLALRQHERLALRRDGNETLEGHVMVFERPATTATMPGPMPETAVASRRRRPRRS